MTHDIYIRPIEQKDPRLGRHVVHDPRSRAFALPVQVDRSTWRTKRIRIIDPQPNPNQTVGNCTMCAKAMQLNAVGNRKAGVVLDMAWAMDAYRWETHNDEFAGAWEPDDTGSSGLAASKTAQHYGIGGEYRWLFNYADGVVQAVQEGHVVNVGTRWDQGMFKPDAHGVVHPGGPTAGGHEWAIRGYSAERDQVLGRCWWGAFRDFWMARQDLDELLHDDGDAHVQIRTT